MLLAYVVLAIALFGLVAVIAEALVKSPSALLDMARDSERFARPLTSTAEAAVTQASANDLTPRLAA